MEKSPKAKYGPEFQQQSLKFFKESGLVLVEAAKRISLPKGTLKKWIYADKQVELAGLGKNQKPLSDLELELSRVKREFTVSTPNKAWVSDITYSAPSLRWRH